MAPFRATGNAVILAAVTQSSRCLMRLGGSSATLRPLKVGISNLLVQELLEHDDIGRLGAVVIQTGNSAGIIRGVLEGYIDVACIFAGLGTTDLDPFVVEEAGEQLVWVRSRDFVISPGSPIPILAWPGIALDDLLVNTLSRGGHHYRIAFCSPDHHAKLSAAKAGLGLTAVPTRMVPDTLVQASEYYLPKLPPLRKLLWSGPTSTSTARRDATSLLTGLFFRGNIAGSIGRPASPEECVRRNAGTSEVPKK